MNSNSSPITIVGAGPNGIMMALVLAHFGIRNIVLEANDELLTEGSRAMTLPRPVLDMLFEYAPGAYHQLRKIGITWTKKTTYFGATMRHLWTYDYAQETQRTGDIPLFLNIAQPITVKFMMQELQQKYSKLSDVRFGQQVESVVQIDEQVVVSTNKDTITSQYVIGCDGTHSIVRKSIDVELVGNRSDSKFIILDITADLPMAAERRYIFNAPGCLDGGGVLIIPAELGIPNQRGWRVDFQLNPRESKDFDIKSALKDGDIDRRLRQIIGDTPYTIHWAGEYFFNQKVAQTYRKGRIILAGDAAHAFSPFGAPGLTSGFGDAVELGKILNEIINNNASDQTLDTYSVCRREFALERQAMSENVLNVMIPKMIIKDDCEM